MAYVLLDKPFHLSLETPEANLSRATHWLNASYSMHTVIQRLAAILRRLPAAVAQRWIVRLHRASL